MRDEAVMKQALANMDDLFETDHDRDKLFKLLLGVRQPELPVMLQPKKAEKPYYRRFSENRW